MKNKSDVVEIFQRSYKMIQTQFMLPIKVFWSDNGGEFVNLALSHFFHTKGVLHETTCPQTPQQNGVAECKNGQILIVARALLLGASVSKRFWMDALIYAVYLLNRLPLRVLDFQTPMQVLTHHLSTSSMLTLSPKVFGCVIYVHLHQNQRSWTPVLSAVSLWVSLLIRKVTDAIILQPDVYMSLWMLLLLRMKCSSLIHPSISFRMRLVVEDITG